MRIPAIRGVIERRILANYRVEPEVMARQLPAPFRPLLVGGYAIGGICLIRLGSLRPRRFPAGWGLGSENAAHRIAVEWDTDSGVREGVYIPRRDTSSRLASWAGGRVFPGVHRHGEFDVQERATRLSVTMQSDDGITRVHVAGRVADALPESSVFGSLAEASAFFEAGSYGLSATADKGRYEALELHCEAWRVEALAVDAVESSYFEDETNFPAGKLQFDCALLMRGIEHEWHAGEDFCLSDNSS